MTSGTKITPKLFGPISQEEAWTLFDEDKESAAAETILRRLGSTGAREDVALVMMNNPQNPDAEYQLPSHFITIRRDDLGTALDAGRCDIDLPLPEVAYLELASGLAD